MNFGADLGPAEETEFELAGLRAACAASVVLEVSYRVAAKPKSVQPRIPALSR